MTVRAVIHIALHFAIPGLVAWLATRKSWMRTWLTMMATMVVDLDHLWANPVYDPNRCSIGFHPLHTSPVMIVYAALVLFPKTRWVGAGLLIHMALDAADCFFMR